VKCREAHAGEMGSRNHCRKKEAVDPLLINLEMFERENYSDDMQIPLQ
jgi:hypothetical protein